MDIKKILRDNGIEEANIEEMEKTILEDIKTDYIGSDVYKEKEKEINKLKADNKKLNEDIELANANDLNIKYANLKREYSNYKDSIKIKEENDKKTSKLTEELKKEGANEKLLNLLLKEFDLDKLVLENDNIKDIENLIKPVKESYSECFTTTTIKGNPPSNPPKGSEPGAVKYTMENLKNMSVEEIKKNYEQIKNDLQSK